MDSNTSFVDRVVLPLYMRGDESHLILTATVLASWLGCPLQLIAPDAESAKACTSLAGTLGVPTADVVAIESASFVDGTVDHLRSAGPVVCVSAASRGGLDVASRSGQPVFLVGGSPRGRVATGPIAVEIGAGDDDEEVLATVAVWAARLECGVRLVVPERIEASEQLGQAEQRLRHLGVEVGVDQLRANHGHPLLVAGRTRNATAIAVPSSRITEGDLITEADNDGVAVLVVPTTGARALTRTPRADEPEEAPSPDDADGNLEVLGYEECVEVLASQSIARIAYVDDGWPIVVPVNYSVKDGVVFIRSREGGKLEAARRSEVVCIEVDETDEHTRSGWSVVGHGTLQVVSDPSTLQAAWDNDPSPWIEGDRWHWLQLAPFSLTGRRVQARPATNPAGR